MAYIVIIFILMFALVIWKNEKVFSKAKIFFVKFKWLIVLEVIIIIVLALINILDNSVIVKEKNPHTNEILNQDTLQEGQIYIYNSINYEEENLNKIKIEKIGITKITVLINGVENEYEYGHGFSYYGVTSCKCGTQIIFEKTLTGIIKIIILAIIIIDLFTLVFIKSKNTDN